MRTSPSTGRWSTTSPPTEPPPRWATGPPLRGLRVPPVTGPPPRRFPTPGWRVRDRPPTGLPPRRFPTPDYWLRASPAGVRCPGGRRRGRGSPGWSPTYRRRCATSGPPTGRCSRPGWAKADRFSAAVAAASAARWQQALAGADQERALWRLLRIGSAPYFVLGASDRGSLRLRIGTAWDWRQHFRIDSFTVAAAPARAQPVVDWTVVVANRRSAATTTISGHVEIRWSHGKFAQPPEAKVYLDTPHAQIPGYWPLV
jgi:hypothetical protein